jgi:hypothetical protein
MQSNRLRRIAVAFHSDEISCRVTGCGQRRGDNLQQRGRPQRRPQQLALRDADEGREMHVLMREPNELYPALLALESVAKNA